MVETVLYFGSFNPIHRGHIAIAEYMLRVGLCDELWLVVSPENPLKERSGLIKEQDRLAMAEIAVEESLFSDRILVSNVEFSLDKPSFTIDTMRVLTQQYSDYQFSILIGSDNVDSLDQWKDYEQLMSQYKFWVYPRDGAVISKFSEIINVLEDAPMWNYSSTQVRGALEAGIGCEQMICKGVEDYIIDKKIWIKEKQYRQK